MGQDKLLHSATEEIHQWAKKYDDLKAQYDHKAFCAEQFQQLLEADKEQYAILKEKAQKLVDALKMIEQMSDPGSYEKAVYEMKSIASDSLSSWNEGKEGKV